MRKNNLNTKNQSKKAETVLTVITICIVVITYFITYKVSYKDPIEAVKNTFIKAELIAIAVAVVVTGLVISIIRDNTKLAKYLKKIAILSTIAIIVFIGVKLHLDNKYNHRETYSKFYDEYEKKDSEDSSALAQNKSEFNLPKIELITPKEAYIKESMGGYLHFSIKVGIYLVSDIVITIIIICLYFKVYTKAEKKKQFENSYGTVYNKNK